MDAKKLEVLRQKYAGTKGGDIFHPPFAAVAAQVFSNADRRKWPFAGAATFLGLPYRPESAAAPNFGGLDVALIGVPMDLGVTNRAGARLDAGVIPLAVGGDHSITYPILKALGKDRPVGMVHIDAHCDTGGTFEGSKFHHGGPFRQAVLDGVLNPERSIQIGIHGGAEYLWEFSFESGMTVLHMEDVAEMGLPAVIAKARAVIGDGPTYVTFDIDSIDPGFAPGTGTPEVGGLTPREVLTMLRGLAGAHIIGGDVMEVAPQYDATTNTAQVAAQMLFTELCLVALDPMFVPRKHG